MAARSFRVGRSSAGLGLFTVRPIAKKEFIVAYSGQWIPTEEARRRERSRKARYMFEVNGRWTIDGSSRRNLGRYANHSCRPNTQAVLRKRTMALVALRPIAAGEEITFDYGDEYFDLFLKDRGCRCAACAAKAARRNRRRGRSRPTQRRS